MSSLERNKKQKIKEEEIFRNFLENFPLSIFILRPDKTIYDCNSVAELYLLKSKKELRGQNFFTIFFNKSSDIDAETLDEMVFNIINFDLNKIIEFEYIDYKDVKTLKYFIDGFQRIKNRYYSGVCLRHQKTLSKAIKRAREMALIPFVNKYRSQ